MKTYWYRFIKSCTTNKKTSTIKSTTIPEVIREVFGEDIASEFVISVTLPRDAFLIHTQILVVQGEAIRVVEQTPSNKTTRYNAGSTKHIFRLTITYRGRTSIS